MIAGNTIDEDGDVRFSRYLKILLKKEGGYVDDPDDRGGETNYGITKEVARQNGYGGDMKSIPMEVVKEIYFECYFVPSFSEYFGRFDDYIGFAVFDMAVNSGVGRALKTMQKALNRACRNSKSELGGDVTPLKEDGMFGENSFEFFHLVPIKSEVLYDAYIKERADFLVAISVKRNNKKFLRGWLKRINISYDNTNIIPNPAPNRYVMEVAEAEGLSLN